jgi:hypothetical protein
MIIWWSKCRYMKQKNGFWGKAREQRPCIYGKPRTSLFEKYLLEAEGNEGGFRKFFRQFIREGGIPRKPDAFELHALFAKSACGWGDCGVLFWGVPLPQREPVQLSDLLAFSLIARGTLMDLRVSRQAATEMVLDAVERMDKGAISFCEGLFPGRNMGTGGEDKIKRFAWSFSMEVGKHESVRHLGLGGIASKLAGELQSRIIDVNISGGENASSDMFESVGYEGGACPSERQLEKFHRFFNREYGGMKDAFFSYPIEGMRLFAILGGKMIPYPSPRGIMRAHKMANKGRETFSAILMHPWEADHLEKAREMGGRGLSVARPSARVVVSGAEFGLFGWAGGRTLERVKDANAWVEFGKTVRAAHERGIALDDAAGRNALWDGEGITLIDFEHTWLNHSGEPLGRGDRMRGLLNVSLDKATTGKRLEAFEHGYNDSELIREVRARIADEARLLEMFL